MRTFKFICCLFLGIFLIILPEPITTAVGLAVISWAILHFRGQPGSISGACRCDAHRLGIYRPSHSNEDVRDGRAYPSLSSGAESPLGKIRRAQATLPLTRGRDYVQHQRAAIRCLKGGAAVM